MDGSKQCSEHNEAGAERYEAARGSEAPVGKLMGRSDLLNHGWIQRGISQLDPQITADDWLFLQPHSLAPCAFPTAQPDEP